MFNIPFAEGMINQSVHSPAAGYADDIMRLYMACTDRGIEDKIDHVHSFARPEKTLWIQVCHTPITFKGRPAVLSTFNDVTEIKEQQVAAQHLAAQLHDENRLLRSSLKERYRLGNILGRSPLMQEVFELILKAAGSNASVAIFGESGSGKELVAQAIHEHSPRKNKNFVAVNCGAIQESLFEREFFGHRKDALSIGSTRSPLLPQVPECCTSLARSRSGRTARDDSLAGAVDILLGTGPSRLRHGCGCAVLPPP